MDRAAGANMFRAALIADAARGNVLAFRKNSQAAAAAGQKNREIQSCIPLGAEEWASLQSAPAPIARSSVAIHPVRALRAAIRSRRAPIQESNRCAGAMGTMKRAVSANGHRQKRPRKAAKYHHTSMRNGSFLALPNAVRGNKRRPRTRGLYHFDEIHGNPVRISAVWAARSGADFTTRAAKSAGDAGPRSGCCGFLSMNCEE